MGLFDGDKLPLGIQTLLQNVVRAAAPGLADQVDQFTQIAIMAKEQLNRIEARQIRLEQALIAAGIIQPERLENGHDGQSQLSEIGGT